MVMSEAKISTMLVQHCEIVPYERSWELATLTSLGALRFWTPNPCLPFHLWMLAMYHQ